ncbi:MAG: type II toxin-antitoxin system HicA family toxin [Gallionella sp.]|nr:MAG: type II toxin-antitoxin system HicA family toxin [Gallionella sp.]
MGKHEKLLARLKSRPKDFTFQELATLLSGFGYRLSNQGKSSGPAVRFVHDECAPISLHKPHPSNGLKRYIIEHVIERLDSERLI